MGGMVFYFVSFDGVSYVFIMEFDNLSFGNYIIYVQDVGGCEVEFMVDFFVLINLIVMIQVSEEGFIILGNFVMFFIISNFLVELLDIVIWLLSLFDSIQVSEKQWIF